MVTYCTGSAPVCTSYSSVQEKWQSERTAHWNRCNLCTGANFFALHCSAVRCSWAVLSSCLHRTLKPYKKTHRGISECRPAPTSVIMTMYRDDLAWIERWAYTSRRQAGALQERWLWRRGNSRWCQWLDERASRCQFFDVRATRSKSHSTALLLAVCGTVRMRTKKRQEKMHHDISKHTPALTSNHCSVDSSIAH